MIILLAHQSEITRAGFLQVLKEYSIIEEILEAATGDMLVRLTSRHRPDVLIIPASWNGEGALATIRRVRKKFPEIQTVLVDMPAQRLMLEAAFQADVNVIVNYPATLKEVHAGIEATIQRETYISPQLSRILIDSYVKNDGKDATAALTQRELEVLRLISEGFTSKAIADQLHVSVRTIDTYRSQLSQKLDMKSVAELTKFAIRTGLTQL